MAGNSQLMEVLAGAAEAEFAATGISAAKIETIAVRAKVSRQFIYKRFGDKRALYQFVRTRVESRMLRALSTNKAVNASPIEALSQFVERWYAVFEQEPVLCGMFSDQIIHGTNVFVRNEAHFAQFAEIHASLSGMLDAARRDGATEQTWDGKTFLMMVASLVIGAVSERSPAAMVDGDWIGRFVRRALAGRPDIARHPVGPVPNNGDAHGQRTSATVTRILDAAERSLSADGMEGMSIRNVARMAEVSPQLVYHYFSSKQDLMNEVHDRQIQRCVRAFDGIDFEGLPVLDGLRSHLAIFWSFLCTRTAAVDFATGYRHFRSGREPGGVAIRAARHKLLTRLENVLARGREEGLIHPDMTALRFTNLAGAVMVPAAAFAGSTDGPRVYLPLNVGRDEVIGFLLSGAMTDPGTCLPIRAEEKAALASAI